MSRSIDLQRSAIAYAADIGAKETPDYITVHFPGGQESTIPVFVGPLTKEVGQPALVEPENAQDDNSAIQKILDVLARAAKPMKAAAIARQAGLSFKGSYFREAISRLRREKRIFKPDAEAHIYWLTGRSLPQ